MGRAGKDCEVERMISPCVQDCPDRLPCGRCRVNCEKFRAYEEERLADKPWNDPPITAGRKAMARDSWIHSKRNKRHMR